MQAFVIGRVGVLFFFGRKWSVACACMGCELTWVWGAMNAKWQDLISFAEALP